MRAGRARASLSAVFLDRDGVINRKAPEGRYITSPEQFELLPGALSGLALLARSDAAIVVVTNQRGVARGAMTAEALEEIHRHMRGLVARGGGRLDGIYHCPHDAGCPCRKPAVGMFEAAASDLGLRLTTTAVIGDQPSDMLAAQRIGALPILVAAGAGKPDQDLSVEADGEEVEYVARDLADAVRWLIDRGHLALARSARRARPDLSGTDQGSPPRRG